MAKILVIDDEESGREILKEALEMDGHEVKVASSWVEGNPLIIRWKPDLVFLDVKMPGVWGNKVLEVLQETVPNLPPIIFYSGMDVSELEKLKREYKAHGYLQKGTPISEILRQVEEWLKKEE